MPSGKKSELIQSEQKWHALFNNFFSSGTQLVKVYTAACAILTHIAHSAKYLCAVVGTHGSNSAEIFSLDVPE